MSAVSPTVMAAAERAELADYLTTLEPEQWDAPSLCEGWRVRDVVAHLLSYEELDGRGLARRAVQARFRPDRMNDIGVTEYSNRSPAELVELLRGHLEPQGLTAGFGGGIALVDGMIHTQDIRRALGSTRDVPHERLHYALRFAVTAPPIRGFWNARGVTLVATDLDWRRGSGPEARGSAEACLMALAGRRGVARDLSGPGRAVLERRLDG